MALMRTIPALTMFSPRRGFGVRNGVVLDRYRGLIFRLKVKEKMALVGKYDYDFIKDHDFLPSSNTPNTSFPNRLATGMDQSCFCNKSLYPFAFPVIEFTFLKLIINERWQQTMKENGICCSNLFKLDRSSVSLTPVFSRQRFLLKEEFGMFVLFLG